MHVVHFKSVDDLDRWFAAHHAERAELYVGFFRKGAHREGVSYEDAVRAALCWGWIDGVKRKVDEESYSHRFTPRRATSIWSASNLARYAELDAAGRIREPGRHAFETRDPRRVQQYSFEAPKAFDDAARAVFAQRKRAFAFFQSQPAGYQRLAAHWVMSAKREETRARRLAAVIESSKRGERAPEVVGKSR